ncbi:hypothetical protein PWG14_13405 (plasmid) [Chromobacterium amazonense]|uniref:hypothetical protein n=1 Tax=Chromobacterium amazonense TaxID=1382803 RepID=UPI00237E7922|nr:hypothetical protein [Chromobacterium amazonense]MDE1713565.1 hypothetical protein [Chromobacterium amazonense]
MSQLKRQFSRSNSLGARDNSEIAKYLLAVGDVDGAMALMQGGAEGASMRIGGKSAWRHTGLVVGFLSQGDQTSNASLVSATQLEADKELIETRIKVTLERFYVHAYPGFGKHHILCEYWGKNQVKLEKGKKASSEEIRFALNVHANDKAAAGVQGQPLFLGVAVGKDGLSFEGRAVNVGSKGNENMLKALNNSAVKNGLSLMTAAQPALKPFVGLAGALVNTAMENVKNVQVHEFFLGLDFSENTTSAKLRLGSYIVVQTDNDNWNWADYQWSNSANLLQEKKTGNAIEANYFVLGISEFSDE